MTHTTTAYILRKDEEQLEFSSEKDACEFLGVKQCSVASCCRRKRKCRGYTIERVGSTTHQATNTRLFKIWCISTSAIVCKYFRFFNNLSSKDQ